MISLGGGTHLGTDSRVSLFRAGSADETLINDRTVTGRASRILDALYDFGYKEAVSLLGSSGTDRDVKRTCLLLQLQ